MKSYYLVSIVLSVMICLTFESTGISSNWTLEIKNETNGNDITLKKNVFTKILLLVHHRDNLDILDPSFDKSVFTIESKDDNIKIYNKQIVITPSLSFEYSAYIGLKSTHNIGETTRDLSFDVKTSYLGEKGDAALNITKTTVKIDNSKTLIEIEPIEKTLPAKGFSYFKLKKEIYNIEKIKIVKDGDLGNFTMTDIEIESYNKRTEFDENENENHGIIFESSFGKKKESEDLTTNMTTYKLKMDSDDNSKCFDLTESSKSFNLTINKNELVNLNDSVKSAIVYSMENITPQKDFSNNIQLQMNIPVAPIIIGCELSGEGAESEKESSKFKDYILKTGSYLLKFDDLNSNYEYTAKCTFTATNYDNSNFEIKIGNKKDYDFITPLYPSRTSNSIPQCLEYYFTANDTVEKQIESFSNLAHKLCQKTIMEKASVISRIMGSYRCDKISQNDDLKKGKVVICVGRTPNFKSKKFRESLQNETSTYFDEHVSIFENKTNTTDKIKDTFKNEKDLNNLELLNYTRYYDLNAPDTKKITLVVNKEEGKKGKLKFNITSTNQQPIQCFYNKEMKKDDSKKYIDLKQNKGKGKSIVLYPNETKGFETSFQKEKENSKKIYTLYMNCYNLPDAKIRYEQTGVFNAYTYYDTDKETEQNIVVEPNVTINCAQKNNRKNPHCLKGKYNQILDKMKTKMPKIDDDVEVDEEVEKFDKLSNDAQLDILQDLIDNEVKKEEGSIKANPIKFIKKAIKTLRHLAHKDCSLFSNGSTNETSETIDNQKYKECRNKKKAFLKDINGLLKDEFKCDNIMNFINNTNKMSENFEDNVKYIILLILELSNNYDSFDKGESQQLYDFATCFQQKFATIWEEVDKYLNGKGSLDLGKKAVKKDLSNLLIQSLANLIKVLHFEEIDGYIDDKKTKKSGIMESAKGKQIHKSMKEYMKNFNDFGEGEYNLTDSIMINVTINNDEQTQLRALLEEGEQTEEEKIIEYKDIGIVVKLHPKYLMKNKKAYATQVVRYSSPLIPIKASGENKDSTLDTFISITLYDNKGGEVNVADIDEKYRPQILYNRAYHKYLQRCFYYNENSQDLEETGLTSIDNFDYKGEKYFKCTTKHLTSFTSGDYYEPPSPSPETKSSGLSAVAIVFIIIGCIAFVVIILILFIYIRRRKDSSTIEEINKYQGNMNITD